MSKLVRDKIPEIIRQNDGIEPNCRIVFDEVEFCSALDAKLDEEIWELRNARDSKSAAEEIADIIEVLLAIGEKWWFSHEQIEQIRLHKLLNRGGFEKGIILE